MATVRDLKPDDEVVVEGPNGDHTQLSGRFLLAAAALLRHCWQTGDELALDPVEDDESGQTGWQASAGRECGDMARYPADAVISLAKELGIVQE